MTALPGPVAVAAWIAVTVTAPLLFYDATQRWEENQAASNALGWTLAAVPVLAALVSARWTRRRSVPAFLTATAVGALITAVFLAGTMAWYRWIVPLDGAGLPERGRPPVDWSNFWWTGLLLAVAGAVIGYPIGLKHATRADPPARRGYAVGAIVAVAGALLAPMTVRLGAEDSTIRYDEGGYGGTGQFATQPGGKPGVLELPAAGRYAIMAVGPTPKVPDCVVLDGGQARRPVERVSIPPGDYGGDAATFAWVATFEVPGPGTYTMTCHDQGEYTVGEVPRIRGAVATLIHWPVMVIMLLGSVPGLLIIANTFRRGAGRASRD